jgi:hypothetical protein
MMMMMMMMMMMISVIVFVIMYHDDEDDDDDDAPPSTLPGFRIPAGSIRACCTGGGHAFARASSVADGVVVGGQRMHP